MFLQIRASSTLLLILSWPLTIPINTPPLLPTAFNLKYIPKKNAVSLHPKLRTNHPISTTWKKSTKIWRIFWALAQLSPSLSSVRTTNSKKRERSFLIKTLPNATAKTGSPRLARMRGVESLQWTNLKNPTTIRKVRWMKSLRDRSYIIIISPKEITMSKITASWGR